jgi:hypothetical protein
LLKTNDSPPKILASQLFFLFDVEPHIDGITDNMTLEDVLLAIGNILYAKPGLETYSKKLDFLSMFPAASTM